MGAVIMFFLLAIGLLTAGLCVWLCVRLWKRGRLWRIVSVAVPCLLTALFWTALDREHAQNKRVEARKAALESELHASLQIGDGPEKIERVLKDQNLRFTYSDVLSGYYASVPTEKADSRIDITISVDAGKRLKAMRVKLFFTFL